MAVGSAQREKIKEQIWASPLGQMFKKFIFDQSTGELEVKQAHDLATHLYSDANLTMARLAGLQLMIEDLYERQMMMPVMGDRIALLETSVELKRRTRESNAAIDLLRQMPIFIVGGLAAGSPLVREELGMLGKGVFNRVLSWVRLPGAAERAESNLSRMNLLRLFSPEIVNDYRASWAASAFLQTFGGYSVLYFFARSGTMDATSVQQRMWFYTLQNEIRLDQL